MEEDDFTFPTVAGAPAEKQQGVGDDDDDGEELPFPAGQLALAATMRTTSPLWPFSSSTENAPSEERATTVQDGEDTPPPGRNGRAVVAQAQQHDAEADDDVGQDRMDLLWEDFDDVEKHPATTAQWPAGSAGGGCGCRCRSATTASDTEFEETSTSGRRYGCGPTMLRASSRAGGAGQFFASGRGRTTTGWTLLLRFFRRLLAVDKTPPSRSHRHGIYVA